MLVECNLSEADQLSLSRVPQDKNAEIAHKGTRKIQNETSKPEKRLKLSFSDKHLPKTRVPVPLWRAWHRLETTRVRGIRCLRASWFGEFLRLITKGHARWVPVL